jgi:hypothetical protein
MLRLDGSASRFIRITRFTVGCETVFANLKRRVLQQSVLVLRLQNAYRTSGMVPIDFDSGCLLETDMNNLLASAMRASHPGITKETVIHGQLRNGLPWDRDSGNAQNHLSPHSSPITSQASFISGREQRKRFACRLAQPH